MDDKAFWTRELRRVASRREFLGTASGLLLLGCLPGKRADGTTRVASYPFQLGIASGDPTPSGVVLWTRLAPDPLEGGGMPTQRVPVRWEVARDEGFRGVVQRGEALAVPELAHSVHVEVEGLEPGRPYWYRFIYGGEVSPTGRTRTAPAAGSAVDQVRFAFVSCQNYEGGYFAAHRHLATEDLDLVVHLGDYIYEGGARPNAVRQHNSPEVFTLEAYRNRYALYKMDTDLQAAHEAFPFVVTWDDHEVENNYAGQIDENGTPVEQFLRRRAAAYQAYYEHMPLRRSSMPTGPDLRLYRRLSYGSLAEFNVLDTRQYRTDQPCGDGFQMDCEEAYNPDRTLLGAEQERWLRSGLAQSGARWNVLANQVPFVPILRKRGEIEGYQMDKWDGAAGKRDEIAGFLRESKVSNPVILTGDVHVSWVAELHSDPRNPDSPLVGTEFVGTSISSGGDGTPMTKDGEAMLASNPQMKYYNALRGYVRCTISPDRWLSEYRLLPQIHDAAAPIRTDASFVVENGRAGVSGSA